MSTNSQPIHNKTLNAQLLIDVEKVLSKLGLSQQEAIIMYFEEIAKKGTIPLDVEIPNNETIQAINDVMVKKDYKTVNSIDELLKDLND